MQIVDFGREYIEPAMRIAREAYDRERARVPLLPPMDKIPGLGWLCESGLGVAALEGDLLIGYLLSYPPHPNAFRSTDAVGVWSPTHGNGAAGENRAAVYAALYQAAAEKWARAGATSHGIGLYAHDEPARAQFFRYGFGLRCADAIRGMDEIAAPAPEGFTFRALAREECTRALPLEHMLDAHMAQSPTFILRPSCSEAEFRESAAQPETRLYAAFEDGEIAAYLKIERSGETFICGAPDYIHITGAYCLPAHRGKNLVQTLINRALPALRDAGYARLGVDFESINPAAHRFWEKYFELYTYSVVRRIDEHAVTRV